MVKRLIFDVDDTLIEWKEEYWDTLAEVLQELNIEYSKDLLDKIISAIGSYEQENQYYNKQKMVEHINKVTGYNFNMNFLDTTIKVFGKCVPKENENIINTLEYLNKKYELVVLTNWFEDAQTLRLESFGINNYFTKVFASESFKVKPNKEAFEAAMEDKLLEECLMIGDSLKKDIQGAINAGMKAIYINPKLPKEEKEYYIVINDITELKNIL